MLQKILALVLLLIWAGFAEAKDQVFVFDQESKILEFSQHISVLEDKTAKLSFEEVKNSKKFEANTKKVPNLGVTESAFWVKMVIQNKTSLNELTIELASPVLDDVQFYYPDKGGTYQVSKLGEYKPFYERNYQHQSYLFKVQIPSGSEVVCYMRVKSLEQIQLPLFIGSHDKITAALLIQDIVAGLYFGIILVMILYNLFIYFTVRDKSYLYYVMYIFMLLGTQASFQGYSFRFLWPESTWMVANSVFLFSALVSITGMMFMREFLQTKVHTPKLDKFVIASIAITFLLIIIGLISSKAQQLIQVNGMLTALFTLFIAIRITRMGYRPAKFYLLAWTTFLLGVFIFVMKDLGILPYNNFTVYMMPAGSAIEVIVLSLALADRINTLKREKEESQENALQISLENEKIIREQNVVLETKVKERTTELEKSNKELNETFTDLKDAQSKLVEAEKMASLGQLTAGIAHEINNPINFVTANIDPLKRDIDEVLELLHKYEEIQPDSDITEKLKEINALREELDVDYLKEEMGSLLTGITEGADRTAEIVRGLRNFSRLDEDALKLANINEGLDSTITLLKSNMSDKVQVVKNYGELPPVECYPGKMNQLFMNILNNGVQAVLAKNDTDGQISVTTLAENGNIKITIADNGTGMSEEVKNKMFDPFFTTKEVGEGTGLGLSIGYSIIENHGGKISVESELGKGTTFIITIPISQT
jgi:signal transduction histidine kinase